MLIAKTLYNNKHKNHISYRDITKTYCQTAYPPTSDIINTMEILHGPKILLKGYIGDAYIESFVLDVAEYLSVDPREILLSVHTDGRCFGIYVLDMRNYSEFNCPNSFIVSLTVQPKTDSRPTGLSATFAGDASFLGASDIARALQVVSGRKVPIQTIFSQGGILRVKTLPAKAIVVRGGKDWEELTLTLVQDRSDKEMRLTIVLEGVMASGLGSVAPPDGAFTRTMDNERPVQLQEFAQRIIIALGQKH